MRQTIPIAFIQFGDATKQKDVVQIWREINYQVCSRAVDPVIRAKGNTKKIRFSQSNVYGAPNRKLLQIKLQLHSQESKN